jgi:hypothetical protein
MYVVTLIVPVGMATRLLAARPWNHGLISSGREKKFFPKAGGHPASYPLGFRGSFPGGKMNRV